MTPEELHAKVTAFRRDLTALVRTHGLSVKAAEDMSVVISVASDVNRAAAEIGQMAVSYRDYMKVIEPQYAPDGGRPTMT